jgi:hypothetical protein
MNSEDSNLKDLIDKEMNNLIIDLRIDSYRSGDEITTFFLNKVLSSNSKEEMLLQFRRGIEMLVKKPLIMTVTSKSTDKIIAVRNDNFLQLLDDRYYSKVQLSSFMDLFKVETNSFKSLNIIGEPHIKLIINYILLHYNTTFRKFMNRNWEYYYIYKFFFDNGEEIKYLLSVLNSYHYSEDENDEVLYNVGIDEVKHSVSLIYEKICELLQNVHKRISD